MITRRNIAHTCKLVTLGKFGATYGVRGWIKVFSLTEKKRSILEYRHWIIEHKSNLRFLEIEQSVYRNKLITVKIKDIDDRETANELTNTKISIKSDEIKKLKSGEFYWNQIINCVVFNIEGHRLGKVKNLIETGSNDVLVVESIPEDGTSVIKQRLIPFIEDSVIKNIDLLKRLIDVDWDVNL